MPAENEKPANSENFVELDPRKCQRIRDNGQQCRAPRVKGKDLCAGHLGLGVAAPDSSQHRAKSLETRRLKAQTVKKRAIDVYREAVEQHAAAFVQARLQIIRDPQVNASDRLRAMEQLESRALGRPVEIVEDTRRDTQELSLHELQERRAALEKTTLTIVEKTGDTQVIPTGKPDEPKRLIPGRAPEVLQ